MLHLQVESKGGKIRMRFLKGTVLFLSSDFCKFVLQKLGETVNQLPCSFREEILILWCTGKHPALRGILLIMPPTTLSVSIVFVPVKGALLGYFSNSSQRR